MHRTGNTYEEQSTPMVTLTDNAIGLIRQLTDRPGLPVEAGLRIAIGSAAGSAASALTVGVVSGPVNGDHVLDSAGARVFLDSEAVRALTGKSLDAALRDSTVTFTVIDQT
ncbi:adhesin [Phytohabitans kaempferiae]|uniref:Adhesin n=1 Tax=Phytohabitans kaempferiae TaxID=1620943 RepID=A0ABV6MAY4_9ACTN